jgi:putative ABC transport system permease protein
MLRRLLHVFRPRALEREMDDEMRFHVEMEAADLVERGAAPEEARHRALLSFGGVERFKDEGRDARGVGPLEDFARDLRYGARSLRRRPGFAMVVVLTLAIGIGGTTAIFGAVHGVLLAPLPYRDPERIITVWTNDRGEGKPQDDVAPGNFVDWRERQRSFATFASANPYSMDWVGPHGPEHLGTWLVSEGFFETFGVRPLLGRVFLPDEYTAGRNNVAVIGENAWRSRFNADPRIIGRQLTLDSVPRTIIGVMPRSFRFPPGREVWQPQVPFDEDDRRRRRSAYLTVVGRLAPGVTLARAKADLGAVAAQLTREYPRTNTGVGVTLVPLPEQTVGHVRKALLVLMGAVGLVLLIACGNVASLLLARAVQREREVAVRVALGAGRGRILRQLGAESLVLALAGGVAGLVVAFGGLAAIRALGPETLPRLDEIAIGPSVLAFALATTLGAAVVFGIAPAVHAAPVDVREKLAAGSAHSGAGRPRRRLQNAFVVVQFALALVLLVGAGLLVRSFVSLLRVERGFDPHNVLAVTVQSWSYYRTPERRAAFVRDATERLAALPGVQAAGMTSSVPFGERIGQDEAAFEIEGRPVASRDQAESVKAAAVTSGYFAALRIPLRRGRHFAASDVASAPPVAIINEALARRHWPNESPLGKRIKVTFGGSVLRTIVGVVADVRHGGLHETPQPTVYAPHAQAATGANAFVIRTAGDPLAALPQVRAEFRSINAVLPLASTTTLETLLEDSLRERRFHLALLGAFAVVALLLAALGVYGVMSHATTERTHEIGVRMALGARGADVLRMVMRQGASLAIAGAIGGLLGATAVTRLLRGMLYGVTPLDPLAYVGAGALLLAAAGMACYLPARRAARLDPVRALRVE